tara:strand:+ start:3300 stop:3839 length:540 start_codon:yes stop_codon:yes gene_type:complete
MLKVWFVRVGDGKHFHSSRKFNMWGMLAKKSNGHDSGYYTRIKENCKSGDILCFITSKEKTKKEGEIIGIAEYVDVYQRKEEILVHINTYSNEQAGWTGDKDWGCQIIYKNLFTGEFLEMHNFKVSIQGQFSGVFDFYENIKNFKNTNDISKKCSEDVFAVEEYYKTMKKFIPHKYWMH